MVERLKQAIEKARQARAEGSVPATPTGPSQAGQASRAIADQGENLWDTLPLFTPDPERLKASRIVSAENGSTGRLAFDVLRTRVLRPCLDNGWTRIAVTSPTKGCGKSLVSLNLAFSIARNPDLRLVLADVDLRSPSMAKLLGVSLESELSDYLTGEAALEKTVQRVTPRLAVMGNHSPVRDSTELILAQTTGHTLAEARRRLRPTVMLFDLPPLLGCDDAQAFLPHVDAVLLVIGGGMTTAQDINDCERLLEGGPHYLGVILNRAEDVDSDDYYAGYEKAEPA